MTKFNKELIKDTLRDCKEINMIERVYHKEHSLTGNLELIFLASTSSLFYCISLVTLFSLFKNSNDVNQIRILSYIFLSSSLLAILMTAHTVAIGNVGYSVTKDFVAIGDTWNNLYIIPKQKIAYAEYCGKSNELTIYDNTGNRFCVIDLYNTGYLGIITALSTAHIRVKNTESKSYFFIHPTKRMYKVLNMLASLLLVLTVSSIVSSIVVPLIGFIISSVIITINNYLWRKCTSEYLYVDGRKLYVTGKEINISDIIDVTIYTKKFYLFIETKDYTIKYRISRNYTKVHDLISYLMKRGNISNGVRG